MCWLGVAAKDRAESWSSIQRLEWREHILCSYLQILDQFWPLCRPIQQIQGKTTNSCLVRFQNSLLVYSLRFCHPPRARVLWNVTWIWLCDCLLFPFCPFSCLLCALFYKWSIEGFPHFNLNQMNWAFSCAQVNFIDTNCISLATGDECLWKGLPWCIKCFAV